MLINIMFYLLDIDSRVETEVINNYCNYISQNIIVVKTTFNNETFRDNNKINA